ncbi:MAG: helix-turn-helix transcriptional regulator [Saccharofermentanales bacterium]|jgi:DNA-binding CsgD family transcriptional regulator
MQDAIPWVKINDYLLKIENCKDVDEYATKALESMGDLVPFDKGLAYIMNGAGTIVGEKYCNFPQQLSKAYLEYYSKLDIVRSPGRDLKKEPPGTTPIIQFADWSLMGRTKYYVDYIEPQKLKYSCHMILRDQSGISRLCFVWDRSKDEPFSQLEQKMLRIVMVHMNNLASALFRRSLTNSRSIRLGIMLEMAELTMREKEIVRLLCQGVSQAEISKKLYISAATTRKHITHIYKKLNVSSLQELLVLLFNSRTHPWVMHNDE